MVQAVPLQANDVLLGDVQVVPLREGGDLVDDRGGRFLDLHPFDRVALEHLVP